MYKRINDYGIIGNLGSCALVGLDGSIDWCGLPSLDSPTVFCALLDENKGGSFRIIPQGEYESTQAYRQDTNILETIFITPSGKVKVTDFMPFYDTEDRQMQPVIYRLVEGVSGSVALEVNHQPRLDYARGRTDLHKDGPRIVARGGDTSITLTSSIPLLLGNGEALATSRLKAG
jgi:GH15 family glucan-1,4-alpha-glucosidase